MLKKFYPDVFCDSVYGIDFRRFYEQGYRVILFDIDNTLVRHDAPADEQAAALFDDLNGMGFDTCLISNNHEPRVKSFARVVNCDYIFEASKPQSKGFEEALSKYGCTKDQMMMVGDQLFTDIWGANRFGILSVCTRQIDRDPLLQIRLKRIGEKIVLFFYRFHRKIT